MKKSLGKMLVIKMQNGIIQAELIGDNYEQIARMRENFIY